MGEEDGKIGKDMEEEEECRRKAKVEERCRDCGGIQNEWIGMDGHLLVEREGVDQSLLLLFDGWVDGLLRLVLIHCLAG